MKESSLKTDLSSRRKVERRRKGKGSVSLVKRRKGISKDLLHERLARLTSDIVGSSLPNNSSDAQNISSATPKLFLAHLSQSRFSIGKFGKNEGAEIHNTNSDFSASKAGNRSSNKKKPLVVVGNTGKNKIVSSEITPPPRTNSGKEAQGIKFLRQALQDQCHGVLLEHQKKPDYEFNLRHVGTMGVVHLFNSLNESQRVGNQILESEKKSSTQEKLHEKQLFSTKAAFLKALRQPIKDDA